MVRKNSSTDTPVGWIVSVVSMLERALYDACLYNRLANKELAEKLLARAQRGKPILSIAVPAPVPEAGGWSLAQAFRAKFPGLDLRATIEQAEKAGMVVTARAPGGSIGTPAFLDSVRTTTKSSSMPTGELPEIFR